MCVEIQKQNKTKTHTHTNKTQKSTLLQPSSSYFIFVDVIYTINHSSTHTHTTTRIIIIPLVCVKKSVSTFLTSLDLIVDSCRSIMEISEETGNAIAGIVSGAVAVMLFNPIDCLRIRWQVCPREERSRTNIVKLAKRVARVEGFVRGCGHPGC